MVDLYLRTKYDVCREMRKKNGVGPTLNLYSVGRLIKMNSYMTILGNLVNFSKNHSTGFSFEKTGVVSLGRTSL